LLRDLLLGTAHALEDRHLAVVVVIDADAEIDLAGVGVGDESLGDTQNRVARRHFNAGEEGLAHLLWQVGEGIRCGSMLGRASFYL
jgi:hypothetical protein